MHVGVTLRNMGVQSSAATMAAGVKAAEAAGLESVWITDHIAIPPDDAEGSGGRYTDTLTTLAWLGGLSERIRLGSGVLILPYRPVLPTAKQIATVQELTGERLLLGVGIGWMDAEFNALGIDRHRRGRDSDQVLEFLGQCFAQDEVELNGQAFLFKPRPKRPPIYIGGRAPHALIRALRYGDGWLPMVSSPEKLVQDLALYERLAAEQQKVRGSVTVMTGLDLDDPGSAQGVLDAYQDLGVERVVCGMRYNTPGEYSTALEKLHRLLNA